MYFLNVTHLKQFYASDLGKAVSRQLRAKMHRIWPHSPKDITLAIGFPIDLWVDATLEKNLLIAMPADQGAIAFPATKNKVFVTHEGEIPLNDNTINRIILMHTLEHSWNIPSLMNEIWRVLAPNGRVLCIVPNRMGIWARSSNSPFGYGRPFTIPQIRSVIENGQLTYLRTHSSIFILPSHNRLMLKFADWFEILGNFFLPMCGGLHLVEAEKQIYASIPQPVRHARPAAVKPVIAPATS